MNTPFNESFINELRWRLADWLSFFACKLRGHKWYSGSAWHGVPGNRASELQQLIWEDVVLLCIPIDEHKDVLDRVESNLGALAQSAGECWGHIKPKQ